MKKMEFMEEHSMYRKTRNFVKVTVGSLVLVGLLSGCGNMVDLEVAEKADSEVVESTMLETSETTVAEVEATTENNVVEKGEEVPETKESADVVEEKAASETTITAESEASSEATTDRNLTIVFNGGSYSAEEKEYEEIYITYEDMEPTLMYAIRYTEVYPDLNASEGVLRMDGCMFEGDEITIDGKGTFDGVEYYRIKRPENCFNPYHSIVPADALSLEKPVKQQAAAVQSVETTQIAEAAPLQEKVNVEELVGADVYASLSEEDKRNLETIFNYDGQVRWCEDPNKDIPGYSCVRNEKGGFTIIDPTIPPEILEKIGTLIIY